MGRILQRFSKDIEVVDSKLPELLTDWVICSVEVIAGKDRSAYIPEIDNFCYVLSPEMSIATVEWCIV